MNNVAPILSTAEYALVLLTLGAITFATRAIPFLLFGHRKVPDMVLYLGRMLPPAIMAMWVIYCLKDIDFMSGSFGLPEIIACVLVVVLHLWKKNALISIFGGTIAYMLLVQLVFA